LDTGQLIVHRLVQRRQYGGQVQWITQGDAAVGTSETVLPEQVLGHVVSLHRAGKYILLTRGACWWVGIFWAKSLPLRPLLLWGGRQIKRVFSVVSILFSP